MYPTPSQRRPKPARRPGASNAWDRAILQTGLQTLAVAALTLGGVALIKLNLRPAEPAPALKELTELTARGSVDTTAKFVLARLEGAQRPAAAILPEPAFILSSLVVPSTEPLPPLVRATFTVLASPEVEELPSPSEAPIVIPAALPEPPMPEPTPLPAPLVIAFAPEAPVTTAAPAVIIAEAIPGPDPLQKIETLPSDHAPVIKTKRVKAQDSDDASAKPSAKKRELELRRDAAEKQRKATEAKKRRAIDEDEAADDKPSRERRYIAPAIIEARYHLGRSRGYAFASRYDYAPALHHRRDGCHATRWIGRKVFFGGGGRC